MVPDDCPSGLLPDVPPGAPPDVPRTAVFGLECSGRPDRRRLNSLRRRDNRSTATSMPAIGSTQLTLDRNTRPGAMTDTRTRNPFLLLRRPSRSTPTSMEVIVLRNLPTHPIWEAAAAMMDPGS